ncbi:MAG: hypothetical protein NZ750_06840 [Anaerolineae bacterium]|nr:hypothetical protein [Anaerolineae bacterium]MDW8172017.1 hypothetical protein [Anaerolineae bacterium]
MYVLGALLMAIVFSLEAVYSVAIALQPSKIPAHAPHIYSELREQLADLPEEEVLGFLTSQTHPDLAAARYRQVANSLVPRLVAHSTTCCRLLIADMPDRSELVGYRVLRRLNEQHYLVETKEFGP